MCVCRKPHIKPSNNWWQCLFMYEKGFSCKSNLVVVVCIRVENETKKIRYDYALCVLLLRLKCFIFSLSLFFSRSLMFHIGAKQSKARQVTTTMMMMSASRKTYICINSANDVSLVEMSWVQKHREREEKVALGCLCNQVQRKNTKPHNHYVRPRFSSLYTKFMC